MTRAVIDGELELDGPMIVKSLELDFFATMSIWRPSLTPRVNLIYGENAQGKTNLLEAVAYLSTARSHRARYDREMIMLDGCPFTSRERWTAGRDLHSWRPKLCRGAKPAPAVFQRGAAEDGRGAVGDAEYRTLLPRGPVSHPGGRPRPGGRFLDSAICQLRPRYAQALSEYNRLYEHKVRILRDWQENPSLLSTLDDFNLRMAQTGALIVHYRAHFIRRLQESAPAIHRDFSGGKESLLPAV